MLHFVDESLPKLKLLIYCSAGVGRTGTFIAVDHLIFQIERESMVDIYGIIYDMRMHRPLMVQTEVWHKKDFTYIYLLILITRSSLEP